MTDISKDAVDRLVKDVANRQKMRTVGVHIVQHVSETLRAMSARIDQLEAALQAADMRTRNVGIVWQWPNDDAHQDAGIGVVRASIGKDPTI